MLIRQCHETKAQLQLQLQLQLLNTFHLSFTHLQHHPRHQSNPRHQSIHHSIPLDLGVLVTQVRVRVCGLDGALGEKSIPEALTAVRT